MHMIDAALLVTVAAPLQPLNLGRPSPTGGMASVGCGYQLLILCPLCTYELPEMDQKFPAHGYMHQRVAEA